MGGPRGSPTQLLFLLLLLLLLVMSLPARSSGTVNSSSGTGNGTSKVSSTASSEEGDHGAMVCIGSMILGSSFVAVAAASAAMLPLTPIDRRALLSSEVLVVVAASMRAVSLLISRPEPQHWCPDLRLGAVPSLGAWGDILDIAPSSGLVSSCGALYVAVVGATAPPAERVGALLMVIVALLALLAPLSLSWVTLVPSAANRAVVALAALGVAGAFARRGPGMRSAALRLQAEVARATFTKMAIGGRRVPGRLGIPRSTLAAAVAMAAAADIVLAPSLACLNVVSAVVVTTLSALSLEAETRVFQLDVTLLILELALSLAVSLANALLAHHHSSAKKSESSSPKMCSKAWLPSRAQPCSPLPARSLSPNPVSSHCFKKWPQCEFISHDPGARSIFTVGEPQAEPMEPRRALRTFWKEDWSMEAGRLQDDDPGDNEWPHLYEEVDLSQSEDQISCRLPMLSKSTQVNLPPKFTKTCSDWESSESDEEDDGRPTDDHSALFSTTSTTSATLSPSAMAAAAAAALSFEWLPSSTTSFWQRKRQRKRRKRRRRKRPKNSLSALELSFPEGPCAGGVAGGAVGGSTCSSESAANSFDVRFFRRAIAPKVMTLDLACQSALEVQPQKDISPDSAVVVDVHLAQRWFPRTGLSVSTACIGPAGRSSEDAIWGLGHRMMDPTPDTRRGAASLNLQEALMSSCGMPGRRTLSLDWARLAAEDPAMSTGFYGDTQGLYDSGASFSHCPLDLDEHEGFSYV